MTDPRAAGDWLTAEGVDELGVKIIRSMAREMESTLKDGVAELRMLL